MFDCPDRDCADYAVAFRQQSYLSFLHTGGRGIRLVPPSFHSFLGPEFRDLLVRVIFDSTLTVILACSLQILAAIFTIAFNFRLCSSLRIKTWQFFAFLLVMNIASGVLAVAGEIPLYPTILDQDGGFANGCFGVICSCPSTPFLWILIFLLLLFVFLPLCIISSFYAALSPFLLQ